MPPAPARSLLALRPVSAVHRLAPRSEACPLAPRDVVRALAVVAARLTAVARGALLAAELSESAARRA